MSTSSPESYQDSIERLFELYKVLDEQVSRLESYIWQTAALLGIGSAIGLISVAKDSASISPTGATLAAILAINASLIWWRFARRWWSIQHLKLDRMDEIEKRISKQMKLEQGSTVAERDIEVMQHTKYLREAGHLSQRIGSLKSSIPANIKAKESQRAANYEYRGNQPVGELLVITIIVLWFLFALQTSIDAKTTPSIPLIAGTALLDLYFWRKK